MPVLDPTYESYVNNGHIQTILPNILRRVVFMKPRREEIATPDDDFLELDWYDNESSDKLVVLSHGLEGNSRRRYMKGMAKHMYENGYNVLAWNYRSCGLKMNKQLRFYHSGDTEDIGTVLNYISDMERYSSIYLIGFSMGGNISLKYLGEQSDKIHQKIKAAVTFSVPIDLAGSSKVLSKWWNRFYLRRFLKSLKIKVEAKSVHYPESLNMDGYDDIKSFKGFDNKYTAPLHGFTDANDYWEQSSSINVLDKIRVPVLILSAKNDSFLSLTCFPYDLAEKSEFIFLETPESGGHVGFWSPGGTYYTEKRALEFLNKY